MNPEEIILISNMIDLKNYILSSEIRELIPFILLGVYWIWCYKTFGLWD